MAPPSASPTGGVAKPATAPKPEAAETKRECLGDPPTISHATSDCTASLSAAVTLRQLFRYAEPFDRFLYTISIIASLGNGVTFPLFAIVMGDVLDSLSSPSGVVAAVAVSLSLCCTSARLPLWVACPHYWFSPPVQRQSLFFVYIGIGALVASTFGVGFGMWAAERQALRVRKAYMRALLQKDVGWHDTNHAAE